MAIDWTQPIEWEDGSPAEIVSQDERWGTMAVYVDPKRLPSRFTRLQGGWQHNGRSFVWVGKVSGVPHDTALYTPMKEIGHPPRIRNKAEGEAYRSMEAMASW